MDKSEERRHKMAAMVGKCLTNQFVLLAATVVYAGKHETIRIWLHGAGGERNPELDQTL